MSEENLNSETDDSSVSAAPTDPSPFEDLLGGIKEGDRQKYSTVEDALKSISPAQDHIKTLEEENATLKRQVEQASNVDKLLEKLEENTNSQANQPQEGKVLDESKISEMLDTALTAKEQKRIEDANVAKVRQAFLDKFGDKAKEAYDKMAEDAGIGGDTLRDLAAKSPIAVMKLAGLTEKQSSALPTKTNSQHRSESFSSSVEKPTARVKMVGYTTEELVNAWKATAPPVN